MSGSLLNIKKDISFGIYFSKAHTWVQKNDYGLIKIGITDYFYKRYGNVFVSGFASTDSEVKAGYKIFQIKVNQKVIDIDSPVNGIVKFVNPDILTKNISDNFGDDWIILLAAFDFLKDKVNLLSNEDYLETVNNSFNKYQKY